LSEASTSILLPVVEAFRTPSQRRRGRSVFRRLTSWFALVLADIVAIEAATLLATIGLLLLQGSATDGSRWIPVIGIAAAPAGLALAAAFGLYDAASLSPLERFRMRVYAAAMLPWPSLTLVALVQSLTADILLTLIITAVLWLPLALLAEAAVRSALIARSAWGADVLLIGSEEVANRIADDLLAHPETGLRPIGFCGDATDLEPRRTSRQLPWLGSLTDLESLRHAADIAVIALSPEVRSIDLASLPFSRIVVVPDIDSVPGVCVRARTLGGVAGFDFANPARARSYHCAKRLLDLLVAVPLLLLALPLIVCAVAAIWVVSPGSAFFVQRRVGWNGRTVETLTLRSMYPDAERRLETLLQSDPAARLEWQTYMKLSRDPRVLPIVGNFIRRTSIDELPQLWNVAVGDISLVGPRPFPVYHVEKFSAEFQKLRCSVRPGLTGLWQVSVRSSADLRQQEAVDTLYIRNWSLWLDFYIMLRTFPAVLSSRGAK
jgi:Undecaprenyl-phosphate galactose phosphotransferase WbaP